MASDWFTRIYRSILAEQISSKIEIWRANQVAGSSSARKNDLRQHAVLHPQNGCFLKRGSLHNLAKRRLEPIFYDSKPCDNHSVHRDKSRNKYPRPWHCVVYTQCKPHKNWCYLGILLFTRDNSHHKEGVDDFCQQLSNNSSRINSFILEQPLRVIVQDTRLVEL